MEMQSITRWVSMRLVCNNIQRCTSAIVQKTYFLAMQVIEKKSSTAEILGDITEVWTNLTASDYNSM